MLPRSRNSIDLTINWWMKLSIESTWIIPTNAQTRLILNEFTIAIVIRENSIYCKECSIHSELFLFSFALALTRCSSQVATQIVIIRFVYCCCLFGCGIVEAHWKQCSFPYCRYTIQYNFYTIIALAPSKRHNTAHYAINRWISWEYAAMCFEESSIEHSKMLPHFHTTQFCGK